MLAQADANAVIALDPIERLLREGRHREAAALCARQHGAALGRLCMALLGVQAEAEEAVQETLMAACGAMGDYRGEGTVRAWLFGIARRQCARRWEQGAREGRKLRLVGEAADEPSPAASVAAARRAHMVREALAELKPSEREALVLRYQGGLSFGEIARMCGIDEAAARKRASRGLAKLRKTITAESVE
jgi:RNA polymerase sigma-70 factor (ECF subfamily)